MLGRTQSSGCFYWRIGRVDLPGGNGEQLLESIKRELMTLSDDFIVYSGHGEPTTIGYERRNNPFLNGYISLK